MNKPPQDYGIPMLTEVLELPASDVGGTTEIPELTQLVKPAISPTLPRDDTVALNQESEHASAIKVETNVAGNAVTDFALNLTPYRAPPSSQYVGSSENQSSANNFIAGEVPEPNMIDDVLAPSSAMHDQSQDEEWALLQDRITERVLAQIMRRIDSQLELRVRDNLADVLQVAIHKLTEEIRAGLQNTLEDVITDAVKREITKVKISKE